MLEWGCKGVLLINRVETDYTSEIAVRHGLWPSNITFGIHRALCFLNGGTKNDSLIELAMGGDYYLANNKLSKFLEDYGKEYALFFVDPMYLANFLFHGGSDAVNTLKDRKITMINNWDNFAIFSPYADMLDMYSFNDQPEEVGVLAVQKLSAQVDGYLENTVSSIQLSLEKYSPINSMRHLVQESEER